MKTNDEADFQRLLYGEVRAQPLVGVIIDRLHQG